MVKRGILIGCSAVAMALAPLAVAAPASADGCPWGTVSRFEGVCTSGQGGSPPPPIVVAPQGSQPTQMPGQFPTINGIPCNQRHVATCFAMAQQP
jgi:hypothetical protein